MKRLALIAALIATFSFPLAASADSGHYTDPNGLLCSWFGSGSLYNVSCSGTIRYTGRYYSYNCDLSIFGSMRSWSCRDINGGHWSGSS